MMKNHLHRLKALICLVISGLVLLSSAHGALAGEKNYLPEVMLLLQAPELKMYLRPEEFSDENSLIVVVSENEAQDFYTTDHNGVVHRLKDVPASYREDTALRIKIVLPAYNAVQLRFNYAPEGIAGTADVRTNGNGKTLSVLNIVEQ